MSPHVFDENCAPTLYYILLHKRIETEILPMSWENQPLLIWMNCFGAWNGSTNVCSFINIWKQWWTNGQQVRLKLQKKLSLSLEPLGLWCINRTSKRITSRHPRKAALERTIEGCSWRPAVRKTSASAVCLTELKRPVTGLSSWSREDLTTSSTHSATHTTHHVSRT